MAAPVKRTKSGCITCRIRRVKCDEARPSCNRCTSTGRTCDGYSALPFSRRDLHAASTSTSRKSPSPGTSSESGPLTTLVSDPAFAKTLEKRYFQFFTHKTVASTNSLIASHFWDRTVLQASHSVPAVKHAVLALSALHQFSSGFELQHREFADKQYQLALEHARSLVSSANPADIDKVLTACVVFICYEGVRGDFKASSMHMDNGRAIARQHANRLRQGHRRQDLIEIQQTLFRLDLPVVCFSDRSSPYHYTLDDFMRTEPSLVPFKFKDVFEARDSLIDLSRWMLILGHMADCTNSPTELTFIHSEKAKCAQRLRLWHEFFEDISTNDDPSARLLILNLRQWYHGCQAISKAELTGPETRWDNVLEHFQIIITVTEEIVRRLVEMEDRGASFSYDIGYVIGTFLTGTRCRDPSVRRRAIQALRALPRQEGIWASVPAAAVAERFMELEERGLDVRCASDIPEYRRIVFTDVAADVAGQKIHATFGSFDEKGEAVELHEVVQW